MRKATQRVVTAFLDGESLKVSNTRTDGESLFLFGRKIAYRSPEGVFISNAGWTSPTTKERLNGLLTLVESDLGIYQRDYVWYWSNGTEFPHNQFVKV